MQRPGMWKNRCELIAEAVDIGLELRRMWKVGGQVGISSCRGRFEQVTAGGKGGVGLVDLAGLGVGRGVNAPEGSRSLRLAIGN